MKDSPWTSTFPDNWHRVRLKNLVGSVFAGTWGEDLREGKGVTCVRAADFDRDHLRVSLVKAPRRQVAPEQFRACALAPGDLILEKSGGGDQQPVGAVVMFDHDVPAVPTNFAARVRPAPDVDARFLCYVFAATYGLRLNVRSIKQTTGLQNLDVDAFLDETWAVPPKGDQVRIANFLDREIARIDAVVSAKRRMIDLGEERVVSSIEKATAGQGGVVRLGRLIERIDQGASPVCSSEPADSGWGVLRLSAVHRGRFRPDENKAMLPGEPVPLENCVRRGDVLVTRGNTPQLVGDACLVRTDPQKLLFPDLIYRLRVRTGVDARFVVYSLLSPAARRQIEGTARGSSQSMVKLRAEDLRALVFPQRSEEEQRTIADRLDELETWRHGLRTQIENQIDRLLEHRQALITATVSGQRDPKSVAS